MSTSSLSSAWWPRVAAGFAGLFAVVLAGLVMASYPALSQLGGQIGALLRRGGAHKVMIGATVLNALPGTGALIALVLVTAVMVVAGAGVVQMAVFVVAVAASWSVAWGLARVVDMPAEVGTGVFPPLWFHGLTYPSRPVAASAAILTGFLIVTRRRLDRTVELCFGLPALLAVIWARLYLGLDYPIDAAAGIVTGWSTAWAVWAAASALIARRRARGRPTPP